MRRNRQPQPPARHPLAAHVATQPATRDEDWPDARLRPERTATHPGAPDPRETARMGSLAPLRARLTSDSDRKI